ncbi:hypothetical protein LLEC1_01002 [Akanthomyces lecanii]|uniref:Nephrocystin 3-like N-terminal domain-containing protein n=1 Tax=Cordyceps confragosa TaxID=2714763 RepID=A0A179ICG5_CORDF|nr:hypothetical protein LLEC1_01002 [Akanthomyces lecanii]
MPVLNPAHYTVVWIAPLEIEARAALLLLDHRHPGGFPLSRGHDYIFLPGDVCGHNVIIATLPAGQEYGTGSAAAIASQVKQCFPNLWFGLLVGVAAGLPNFSRTPPLDIRLGDVLVSLPEGDSPALVAYDLGKETENNEFQLFHGGRVVSATETVVRSAIGRIKLEAPNDVALFLHHYEKIKEEEHSDGSFVDPGQENDLYYHMENDGVERPRQRQPRPHSRRTRVWYGPLGSGDKLMKNRQRRNELRDRYNIIGLEMEAAGTMNRIAVGVIRGVCDYGDEHKNKKWQPYAAAMAAAYAKAVLAQITPGKSAQVEEVEAQSNPLSERLRMTGTLTEEEEKMILRSLAFDQIEDRHNTIEPALADTCQWLLETTSFRDWLDPRKLDEHHGFLKIDTHKFALQNSRETGRRSNVIFFFFHARGDDLEKSTTGMYRSLLLQLFEKFPHVRHVLNSFRLTIKYGSIPGWTTQHLKSLFSQALHALAKYPLMLFIDALDECDEDQIRDMVAFLQDTVSSTRQKNITLQICFASRYYPQITIEKGIHLDIGSQEGHHQDIRIYVSRKLRIGHDNLAQKIRATLIEKASGVFLWVFLVVQILQKLSDTGNRHELDDRLQKTPKDLNALFHDIMTRDGNRHNELLWCIQWILFAKHPLSPNQLREAILCGAAPDRARDWCRGEVENSEVNRFIIDCSKGLAEITESETRSTVQFIHESVRDFLFEYGRLQKLWPDVRERFEGKGHERLKQCCLCYFNIVLTGQSKDFLAAKAASASKDDPRQLALEEAFDFLEYAVLNVIHHSDVAEGLGVNQDQFLESFPVVDWIELGSLVEQHGKHLCSAKASILYILSTHNAGNLIKCCPNNLAGFEREDERYGLPILAAYATGSRQAVLALMEVHIDSEPQKRVLHDICKQYACSEEKESLRVARREWRFSNNESLLLNLVKAGNEFILDFALASAQCDTTTVDDKLLDFALTNAAIAQVLFKHDVTVALAYKDSVQLQIWAASQGCTEVLQVLVDRDGTTEMPGGGNVTPLLAAARAGQTSAVQWLLERKANLEAKDYFGTPLSWAIQGDFEAIAELLLRNGARLENAMMDGQPPLCWAAGNGRVALVRLCIGNGANMEAADGMGKTPLCWAAAHGNEDIVRLLIGHGANIEAADRMGKTPLCCAAEYGNEDIVRLLVGHGANIEAADEEGQTPLSWAAQLWTEATARLLVDSGANIEAANGMGKTPLCWAAEHGNEDVVQLLIGHGANIEAADGMGKTPLWWAAEHDNPGVVRLLIDNGANTEAADESGDAPIHRAARWRRPATVELLIDGGANVEAADEMGRTALYLAVEHGTATVVDLLIENGADLEMPDHRGNTPLSMACLHCPQLAETWVESARIYRHSHGIS